MSDGVFIIDSGPSERGWHYFAEFMKCPMRFYWSEVDPQHRGREENKAALARGTLVHVGLAHHFARRYAIENGHDPERVLNPLTAMAVMAERLGSVGAEMLDVARFMVTSYLARYPEETFKVVGIERAREIVFHGVRYTARIDREVMEPDSRIWFHDVKTTSRLRGTSLSQYTLHGQFFGHIHLGRAAYGESFGGVLIDMIDETGECVRKPVEPAPFALRAFPGLVATTASAISNAIETLGTDANKWMMMANPDETICYGKYGACPCVELCRWGA